TLLAIHVDRGQKVKTGDVLAEIVSLELQNLQLDLLKAHLEGQLRDDTLKRLKDAGDSVQRPRVLEAQREANASGQQVESLMRKLKLVGLTDAQLTALKDKRKLIATVPVRSPIAGVVVSFDRVLGQAIKAEEPLFTVHDLSRPSIQAHIGERELGRVRLG